MGWMGWMGWTGWTYLSAVLLSFTRVVELVNFVGELFEFRNDELTPEGPRHQNDIFVDRSANFEKKKKKKIEFQLQQI